MIFALIFHFKAIPCDFIVINIIQAHETAFSFMANL